MRALHFDQWFYFLGKLNGLYFISVGTWTSYIITNKPSVSSCYLHKWKTVWYIFELRLIALENNSNCFKKLHNCFIVLFCLIYISTKHVKISWAIRHYWLISLVVQYWVWIWWLNEKQWSHYDIFNFYGDSLMNKAGK